MLKETIQNLKTDNTIKRLKLKANITDQEKIRKIRKQIICKYNVYING